MDYSQDCRPQALATAPRARTLQQLPLPRLFRSGERFRTSIDRWPTGSEYSFGPSGHELTLFRSDLTPSFIRDFFNASTEFALLVEGPFIVFAYRLGETLPWDSASYCWHLQPESRRALPSGHLDTQFRALLWVTLVDANHGIVHGQRCLTLSPEFTHRLHGAIRDQASRPFQAKQCASAVRSMVLAGKSIESRLATRATARSRGNA